MAGVLDVREVLYSWNTAPRPGIGDVRIDDETLRDGFQGAFAPRITLDQKLEVLRLMDAVGVTYAMLGFPAISEREQRDCLALIAAIQAEGRSMVPCLLGRTHVQDAEVIARLAHESDASLLADLFVGTSPIRREVEGWSLDQVVERCRTSCGVLARAGVRFALSFEDASRTPPDELDTLVRLAIDLGCERITLCDTVGEALPDGARKIVARARDLVDRTCTRTLLAFHGHNDRGVAVANTLAAAEAGADVLSGTFLGLGERAGNAALEQVITYLHAAGSRRYRVELLPKLAELVSRYAEQPIPVTAPIVGLQAFATTAGVHAAALLKARRLGREFEDLVYSGVPASAFGRSQAVLLGPTSGLANARHAIELYGHPADDRRAERLLAHAKSLARWMSPEEVIAYLKETP